MLTRNILDKREDLLNFLPKNSVGVEIGVFKGQFSDIILDIVNPSMFYLIDPWSGELHSGDKNGKNIEYIDGNDCYDNIIIKKYENKQNIKILRSTSGILRTFDDDYLDWGYVDGNHSYLGVKHDLEILRNKVKNGGIIMGHDYLIPRFQGVVKAVNQFCRENNLKIEYLSKDGCPSYFLVNEK
jgi:hypothetical protein